MGGTEPALASRLPRNLLQPVHPPARSAKHILEALRRAAGGTVVRGLQWATAGSGIARGVWGALDDFGAVAFGVPELGSTRPFVVRCSRPFLFIRASVAVAGHTYLRYPQWYDVHRHAAFATIRSVSEPSRYGGSQALTFPSCG